VVTSKITPIILKRKTEDKGEHKFTSFYYLSLPSSEEGNFGPVKGLKKIKENKEIKISQKNPNR
jgi:hypothetical protein